MFVIQFNGGSENKLRSFIECPTVKIISWNACKPTSACEVLPLISVFVLCDDWQLATGLSLSAEAEHESASCLRKLNVHIGRAMQRYCRSTRRKSHSQSHRQCPASRQGKVEHDVTECDLTTTEDCANWRERDEPNISAALEPGTRPLG